MVFAAFKQKFLDIKEERKFKKDFKQDLKQTDELLRQQAKEQARRDFLDSQGEAIAERKIAFAEQEREKYAPQIAKLQDTRTPGQKLKEGVQRIGEKAQRVGGRVTSDTGRIGRDVGIPDVQPPSSKENIFFGKYQQFETSKNNLKIQKQQMAHKFNGGGGPGFQDIIGRRDTGKGFSQVLGTTGSGQGFMSMLGNKKSKESAKDKLRRFL